MVIREGFCCRKDAVIEYDYRDFVVNDNMARLLFNDITSK